MDAKTLYKAAAARDVIDDDQQVALACARDRDALQTESLGDWARHNGHDYDRVFREWRAGRLWCRRRDARGLLKVSMADDLRDEVAEHGALVEHETEKEDTE